MKNVFVLFFFVLSFISCGEKEKSKEFMAVEHYIKNDETYGYSLKELRFYKKVTASDSLGILRIPFMKLMIKNKFYNNKDARTLSDAIKICEDKIKSDTIDKVTLDILKKDLDLLSTIYHKSEKYTSIQDTIILGNIYKAKVHAMGSSIGQDEFFYISEDLSKVSIVKSEFVGL